MCRAPPCSRWWTRRSPQRRKTLRAALATWAGSAANAAASIRRAAGVDPGARGEALGVAEFARIAAAQAEIP